MLPIANKPILEHLLVEVIAAGIREFIIVVGYSDEQVRDYFGGGENWGVHIDYANQRKQFGTADAIKMIEGLVDGNFLVINGDIIVNRKDIRKLVAKNGNTISVIEVKNNMGLGMVELSEGKVVHIYEKVEKILSGTANAGLYLFTTDIFDAISRTAVSPRGEYEITDSLEIMLDDGTDISYHKINHWVDLSYPWDLLSVNESLMAGIKSQNLGDIEENAVIKGTVSIGKNTVIRSGSYIVGPVLIGENCEIGPNCYIRPYTTIADGCRVGSAVEVKNCIIMRNSKLPHHNYVGDSILGEGCNFGAGTKVANLRLDKKEVWVRDINTRRRKMGAIIGDKVEIGINACINVGTIMGNGARIGPGAVASGVILPGATVF
jgi:bifunctional UDP-N-acetylglucosamine pyrophosphorylase/glucosamine-1-phosphate N-acetyltransferase